MEGVQIVTSPSTQVRADVTNLAARVAIKEKELEVLRAELVVIQARCHHPKKKTRELRDGSSVTACADCGKEVRS